MHGAFLLQIDALPGWHNRQFTPRYQCEPNMLLRFVAASQLSQYRRKALAVTRAVFVFVNRAAHCGTGGLGRVGRAIAILLPAFALAQGLRADTITFEGLADGTHLFSQFPGLTFNNAVVLTSGVSLDEFEFPGHSGVNVASDDSGPVSIVFTTPAVSFDAFFTYSTLITVSGFDSQHHQVVATSSSFTNNEGLSGVPGSSPNEFLRIAFPGGIAGVTISGGPLGGSFVFDDARVVSNTPEPSTFALLLSGFLLVAALHRSSK